MPRSSKTEKNLWLSLKKHLPKKTHSQRIENRVSEGMPDSYLCMDGVPVWVELKIIKRNGITLQPSQIAWHLSHSRCGGVSFFLLRRPSSPMYFYLTEHLRPRSKVRGPMTCGPSASGTVTCGLRLLRCGLRPKICGLNA